MGKVLMSMILIFVVTGCTTAVYTLPNNSSNNSEACSLSFTMENEEVTTDKICIKINENNDNDKYSLTNGIYLRTKSGQYFIDDYCEGGKDKAEKDKECKWNKKHIASKPFKFIIKESDYNKGITKKNKEEVMLMLNKYISNPVEVEVEENEIRIYKDKKLKEKSLKEEVENSKKDKPMLEKDKEKIKIRNEITKEEIKSIKLKQQKKKIEKSIANNPLELSNTVKNPFAVSDSPAFDILGVNPQKVSRPTSISELTTALINGVDKDGKLKTGVAIEINPFVYFQKETIQMDYDDSNSKMKNYGYRFLKRFKFSLATTKSTEKYLSDINLGMGLSFVFWDWSDPILIKPSKDFSSIGSIKTAFRTSSETGELEDLFNKDGEEAFFILFAGSFGYKSNINITTNLRYDWESGVSNTLKIGISALLGTDTFHVGGEYLYTSLDSREDFYKGINTYSFIVENKIQDNLWLVLSISQDNDNTNSETNKTAFMSNFRWTFSDIPIVKLKK